MNSFEKQAYGVDRDQSQTRLYVYSMRKDGKFPVRYAFSGKAINKVLTAEKLQAEKNSGKYQVIE